MVMAKTKPRFVTKVPDGRGGMIEVRDRRFEKTAVWPVQLRVSVAEADRWFEYLDAELEKLGWSSSGIRQIESCENSGTVNVNAGNTEKPELSIVWGRRKGADLLIQARSDGARALSD